MSSETNRKEGDLTKRKSAIQTDHNKPESLSALSSRASSSSARSLGSGIGEGCPSSSVRLGDSRPSPSTTYATPNTRSMFRRIATSRSTSSDVTGSRLDEARMEASQCFTRQKPMMEERRRNHPKVIRRNDIHSLDETPATELSVCVGGDVDSSGGSEVVG